MTLFIAGSVTHETISAPLALLTGRAFGEFQAMLSDMEDGALGETIPDFHNIEFRIGGLRDAVARDEAGRLGKVRWMADELIGRQRRDVSRRTAPPRRPASEARHALRHEGQQPAFRRAGPSALRDRPRHDDAGLRAFGRSGRLYRTRR